MNTPRYTVSLSTLTGWNKNPRGIKKDAFERLKRQITAHGQFKPVLATPEGEVIGGNMRLKAYQDLGITEVWVSIVEPKDETEKVAIALADNDRAGYYEEDALAELISSVPDLVLEDYHLDLGKTLSAKDLLDKFRPTEEDDFDVEEALPGEPISKLSDIYQLGNHRLMCGDSVLPENVASLLDGITPIAMVTDPPYGVEYDPSWREECDLGVGKKSKGKVMNDDIMDWTEAYKLYPGGIAYVWHSAKYSNEFARNLESAGYEIISQIIWSKQHFALSRGDYHWQHEPCWYAVKKGFGHNWQGARDQSTIWEIQNNNSFGNANKEETWGHGTQKPMECMSRPIRNNSKEGDSIYDPFGGSGTTLIACEQLERNCYMMELDPRYCDVIIKRWEQFTGGKAINLTGKNQE